MRLITIATLITFVALSIIVPLIGELNSVYEKYNSKITESSQYEGYWVDATRGLHKCSDKLVTALSLGDQICYQNEKGKCKEMNDMVGEYWGFLNNWTLSN